MPHRLDHLQGETLVHLAHTLRPEWTVPSLRSLLQAAGDLPGQDWEHVVRALLAYATARKPDGSPAKLTPRFFPEAGGPHWTTTHTVGTGPREYVKAPACEDHPEQEAATCRCCWADVKVGIRDRGLVGKRMTGEPPTLWGEGGETPARRAQDAASGDEWGWDG